MLQNIIGLPVKRYRSSRTIGSLPKIFTLKNTNNGENMIQKLNIALEVDDYDIQTCLNIKVDLSNVSDLSLGFILLKEQLIKSLETKFTNFTCYIEMSAESHSHCNFLDLFGNVAKLQISTNELEFTINFLLTYFRDGIGDVDHIDVDFDYKAQKMVTFTIKIDRSRSVSHVEINKILGL